ncbi:MAG: hypothetical protein OEZ36_03520 [Spirochaetota bacterium]|nr:hypothetical protein [Spirochaetota bacterium]
MKRSILLIIFSSFIMLNYCDEGPCDVNEVSSTDWFGFETCDCDIDYVRNDLGDCVLTGGSCAGTYLQFNEFEIKLTTSNTIHLTYKKYTTCDDYLGIYTKPVLAPNLTSGASSGLYVYEGGFTGRRLSFDYDIANMSIVNISPALRSGTAYYIYYDGVGVADASSGFYTVSAP